MKKKVIKLKIRRMKKGLKIKWKLLLFIICTFLFFFYSLAYANHIGEGSIEKTCIWNNGTAIVGAKVLHQESGTILFTNSSGKVLFENVQVGLNHISVDLENDDPPTWENTSEPVTVVAGETTYVVNTYVPPTI